MHSHDEVSQCKTLHHKVAQEWLLLHALHQILKDIGHEEPHSIKRHGGVLPDGNGVRHTTKPCWTNYYNMEDVKYYFNYLSDRQDPLNGMLNVFRTQNHCLPVATFSIPHAVLEKCSDPTFTSHFGLYPCAISWHTSILCASCSTRHVRV